MSGAQDRERDAIEAEAPRHSCLFCGGPDGQEPLIWFPVGELSPDSSEWAHPRCVKAHRDENRIAW